MYYGRNSCLCKMAEEMKEGTGKAEKMNNSEREVVISKGEKEVNKPVLKGKESLKKQNVKKQDPYLIIKAPLSTEKAIRQIEFDNKLVFVVHPQATKRDVKQAVETLFKVKVNQINIHNSVSGEKRAYVRLGGDSLASDVSADLGLI